MTFLHVHPVINIAYILYTILWSFLFTQFIHMNTLRIIILIIIASLQAFIYIELGSLLLCQKLYISYTEKNSFQLIVTFYTTKYLDFLTNIFILFFKSLQSKCKKRSLKLQTYQKYIIFRVSLVLCNNILYKAPLNYSDLLQASGGVMYSSIAFIMHFYLIGRLFSTQNAGAAIMNG